MKYKSDVVLPHDNAPVAPAAWKEEAKNQLLSNLRIRQLLRVAVLMGTRIQKLLIVVLLSPRSYRFIPVGPNQISKSAVCVGGGMNCC